MIELKYCSTHHGERQKPTHDLMVEFGRRVGKKDLHQENGSATLQEASQYKKKKRKNKKK